MVLVDEADLAGSKTYQNVLSHLYNTRVRLGLSGTIYMSGLKKDELKNWNLESFFGLRLFEFRLKESIKKGYSTNVIVKLVDTKPYYGEWQSSKSTYKEIYDDTITNSYSGCYVVEDRVSKAVKAGNINHPKELIDLALTLERNPEIRYCPHGRPIYFFMSKSEIEKNFKRT